MTTSREITDEAGRKRHLEELFADEPFLSPTMKARRMHEKLLEMRAMESAGAERPIMQPAPVLELTDTLELPDQPEFLQPERGPGGRQIFTLAEAREKLRGHGVPDPFAFTPSDPLSYFRTQVLSLWFRKVDRRELDADVPADLDSAIPTAPGRAATEISSDRKGF